MTKTELSKSPEQLALYEVCERIAMRINARTGGSLLPVQVLMIYDALSEHDKHDVLAKLRAAKGLLDASVTSH